MKSIKELAALSLIGVAAFTQVAAMPLNVASDEVTTVSYMSKLRNTTRTVDAEHGNVEATIAGIIGQNGFDPESTDYALNEVYDADNRKYGYVVEFTYNDQIGYSILKCTDAGATPMELVFGQYSPYHDEDGKYLYPSMGMYMLQQDDGSVTALSNNIMLQNGDSSGHERYESDRIGYSYGKLYYKEIDGINPDHDMSDINTEHTNFCANMAGVIVLEYWNRKYENAILSLGDDFMDRETYNFTIAGASHYVDEFYDSMNTNPFFDKWGGTFPENCYWGFENIITERKKHVKRTYVNTYDEMVEQIDKGVPIFIVSDDYIFTQSGTLSDPFTYPGDHGISFNYTHSWGIEYAHTFVGYGYAEYELYQDNGEKENIHFIKIATGWGYPAYFNIEESSVMSAAAIYVARC